MLLELFFTLIFGFVSLIIGLLSMIPAIPTGYMDAVFNFLDLFTDSIGFVNYFVPIPFVVTLIALSFIIDKFALLYGFMTFIFKKIPILNKFF